MESFKRPGGRIAAKASHATLNHVEVEGVVARWPLLRETNTGQPMLVFDLDVSTASTLLRVPVFIFGTAALEYEPRTGTRPLRPAQCVKITGKIGGEVRKGYRGASWSVNLVAQQVEMLGESFTGQVIREPVKERERKEDFPAEVF